MQRLAQAPRLAAAQRFIRPVRHLSTKPPERAQGPANDDIWNPSAGPADGEEGVTKTMMPWRGFYTNLMKKALGEATYDKIRRAAQFRPDETHGLEGAPVRSHFDMPGVERIKGYRYPAPSSQETANIPLNDEGYDPFDITYLGKDTKRNSEKSNLVYNFVNKVEAKRMLDEGIEDMVVIPPGVDINSLKLSGGGEVAEKVDEVMSEITAPQERLASKGNAGNFATGPSAVIGAKAPESDPYALRSAMGATHEGMQASLANHEPTQLMTYPWEEKGDALLKDWESKGLPPQPGQRFEWKRESKRYVASW